MIEHFIDGKSSGIIEPDTEFNRHSARVFMARYNNHYGKSHKITFKKV